MVKPARSFVECLCFKPSPRANDCNSLYSSLRRCSVTRRLLDSSRPRNQRWLSTANGSIEMQYQLPRLDNVEDVEKYRRGGFHPVHLADTFKDGRYHILHKLGYGGFSTAWLARDEHLQRLVSLKVLTAEASQQQKELKMLQYLEDRAQGDPRRHSILSILDNFSIQGPNGTHMYYVSPVGGPSISQLSDSPGQVAGSRRLHARLARKLAEQLANAVLLLHSLGIAHGGKMIHEWLLELADR